MLSNYCCAEMSNFKRLRLLVHTLRQGYDVRPVYTFYTKLLSPILIKGKSSIAPERLYHETIHYSFITSIYIAPLQVGLLRGAPNPNTTK